MVFHNICEVYGDHCLQDWIVDGTTSTCPTNPLPTSSETGSKSDGVAVRIRNTIKDHIRK